MECPFCIKTIAREEDVRDEDSKQATYLSHWTNGCNTAQAKMALHVLGQLLTYDPNTAFDLAILYVSENFEPAQFSTGFAGATLVSKALSFFFGKC